LPSVSSPVSLRTPPAPLLIRLIAVAVAAPLLVRSGLPRLQRWLEPGPTSAGHRPADPGDTRSPGDTEAVTEQYGRWANSIIRRGQPVVRPGCLTRGVTLYYGLRREGLDVALCFGVGSPEGQMAGHCWLEMDGHPLLEGTDPRIAFTEVVRVSGSGVTPREGSPG
jgi:hypothetical protein